MTSLMMSWWYWRNPRGGGGGGGGVADMHYARCQGIAGPNFILLVPLQVAGSDFFLRWVLPTFLPTREGAPQAPLDPRITPTPLLVVQGIHWVVVVTKKGGVLVEEEDQVAGCKWIVPRI